jgi:hypothetical protein
VRYRFPPAVTPVSVVCSSSVVGAFVAPFGVRSLSFEMSVTFCTGTVA